MNVLTLKVNEEGFVLCPECDSELRGSGIEYFSGATIVVDPNAPMGWHYTTESTCAEGSDLKALYCPRCFWMLELHEGVAAEVGK